jgi:hypothetical protein
MKITCDLKLSYVTFELEDQAKAEEFLRNLAVLLSKETKIPQTNLDTVFDITLNHNALTIKLRDRINPHTCGHFRRICRYNRSNTPPHPTRRSQIRELGHLPFGAIKTIRSVEAQAGSFMNG